MTRPDNPKREPRKRFNKQFRQEALELWRQSGKSGAEIATGLGIRANNLCNWAKQSESVAPASADPNDLARSLRFTRSTMAPTAARACSDNSPWRENATAATALRD